MKFKIEAVNDRTTVFLEDDGRRIDLKPEAISIDLGPDGHNTVVMAFPLRDVAITLGGDVSPTTAEDMLRANQERR